MRRQREDGESCARIAKFLYLDDDTIRGWYKSYRQDGWDALARDGYKGGQSRMKQAQEVAAGSPLLSLDGRNQGPCRRPKALPRGADVAKQAEFIAMYENMLNSLADDEAVYFAPSRRLQANTCQAMGTVHPEYQSKPAFGWVKRGQTPRSKPLQVAPAPTFTAH